MKNIIKHKLKLKGRTNILFLHGYGQTKEMMYPLANRIQKSANFLAIDLPGNENLPLTKTYTMDDYITYVEDVLKKENFVPDLIVGHSFGGKLAAFYALKHPTALLLLAPSVIKPSFSMRRLMKILLYKILKKLKQVKIIKNIPEFLKGSRDYQATDGLNRLTFLNIVNSYLTKKELSLLEKEIYIVYGNTDQEITYRQMQKLNKYCPNSHLIVINGDHFAYLLNVNAIANLILAIIGEICWNENINICSILCGCSFIPLL